MRTPAAQIEASLRLGIAAEGEADGNQLATIVNTITDEQISWISSWLAGEGFAPKPEAWKRPLDFEELAEDKTAEILESRRDDGEEPTVEEMFLSGALWVALMAEDRL